MLPESMRLLTQRLHEEAVHNTSLLPVLCDEKRRRRRKSKAEDMFYSFHQMIESLPLRAYALNFDRVNADHGHGLAIRVKNSDHSRRSSALFMPSIVFHVLEREISERFWGRRFVSPNQRKRSVYWKNEKHSRECDGFCLFQRKHQIHGHLTGKCEWTLGCIVDSRVRVLRSAFTVADLNGDIVHSG